jgi:hypothetical protein
MVMGFGPSRDATKNERTSQKEWNEKMFTELKCGTVKHETCPMGNESSYERTWKVLSLEDSGLFTEKGEKRK